MCPHGGMIPQLRDRASSSRRVRFAGVGQGRSHIIGQRGCPRTSAMSEDAADLRRQRHFALTRQSFPCAFLFAKGRVES